MKHESSNTRTRHLTMALLAAILAPFLVQGAQAHEGHGIAGSSHWHAGDVLPMTAALIAVVAVVVAWSRRK